MFSNSNIFKISNTFEKISNLSFASFKSKVSNKCSKFDWAIIYSASWSITPAVSSGVSSTSSCIYSVSPFFSFIGPRNANFSKLLKCIKKYYLPSTSKSSCAFMQSWASEAFSKPINPIPLDLPSSLSKMFTRVVGPNLSSKNLFKLLLFVLKSRFLTKISVFPSFFVCSCSPSC